MRAVLNTVAVLAAARTAIAQTATIIIEASHGGAGSDLTNTTITVPIGTLYSGDPALETVSTMYLTGSTVVPVTSITCSTFMTANGSDPVGLAFNSTDPSELSTNTVRIGAVMCRARTAAGNSSSSSTGVSSPSSSSSTVASSSSTAASSMSSTGMASSTSSASSSSSLVYSTKTSYVVVTETPSGSLPPKTVTSVIITTQSAQPSSSPGSSTTSAASSPSSSPGFAGVNAASSMLPQEIVYHALAVVGLGIAFAL